jgi:spoIIIJ-associated protein
MTSIIAEGKTTNEAIEKGLKSLNASKKDVNIKIIEEEKRSFFSILAPKVVKVEITLKENRRADTKKTENPKKLEQKEIELSQKDFEKAKENITKFLNKFLEKVKEKIIYEISLNNGIIEVQMQGENAGFLIGYRGEALYAMQTLLTAIANKGIDARVILRLDIENYKEKRIKTLENLARRTAETVMRTGKTITLEPMQAYERKIIHSALQDNKKICTESTGVEPRRRIVISLIK